MSAHEQEARRGSREQPVHRPGILPSRSQDRHPRTPSCRVAGRASAARPAWPDRPPSRRAQLDRVAATLGLGWPGRSRRAGGRGGPIGLPAVSPRRVRPVGARPSPSRAAIETKPSALPPGRSSEAIPRAAASSRASAPRSSEPHGKLIVSSSATPRSSVGGRSAEATTKRAFGDTATAAVGRAARREASAIAAAFASIPMTRASGSARARAMTARPSPVPRSMTTRSRSGDPLSELADVHLGEAAAGHGTHPRNLHLVDERG